MVRLRDRHRKISDGLSGDAMPGESSEPAPHAAVAARPAPDCCRLADCPASDRGVPSLHNPTAMNDSGESGVEAPDPAVPAGTVGTDAAASDADLPPRQAATGHAVRPVERQPDADRGAAVSSLSAFDWLGTIFDELLVARRHGDAGTPAPPPKPTHEVGRRTPETGRLDFDSAATAVLSRVILGYAPIIDARHEVIATRLTVVPVDGEAVLDAAALLDVVSTVWPADGAAVSLNVASQTLLTDLLHTAPPLNVMIEVPSFLAGDPDNTQALIELAARGIPLLLKGRPLRELPREVLGCFKWSIIDLADERRSGRPPATVTFERVIPHIQTGVRSMAQVRDCFQRGAAAVIGWPIHEPEPDRPGGLPELRVVLELLAQLDRADPVEALERTLLQEPVLAFELLRHVAETAIGLQVETTSFAQAISLLGGAQFRRWLVGWLARTDDGGRLRPVKFAALRRGLLMKGLAAPSESGEMGAELFMCGVFSLLDRMFSRPADDLLGPLVLPDRVRQALIERQGPFLPLLELACAIESAVPHDIRIAAEAAFLEPIEINRALLRALTGAAALQ